MTDRELTSTAGRTRDLEYVAEHLLTRAAILVRLLVKQVHNREVSRTEMSVLSILLEGSRRVTELAELEGVAQPTMTVLLRRLHERGWVERESMPDDGRVVLMQATAAGRTAHARLRAEFLAAMRADLEEQSDEQLHALARAAETLDSFVGELQRRA